MEKNKIMCGHAILYIVTYEMINAWPEDGDRVPTVWIICAGSGMVVYMQLSVLVNVDYYHSRVKVIIPNFYIQEEASL